MKRIQCLGINPARFFMAFFMFLLLYGISIVHLWRLQIYDNTFFVNLAQRQYKVTLIQKPSRQYIYDRKKQLLTLNKESSAAFITPNNIHDRKSLEQFLQHNFPQARQRLQEHSHDLFMYIKRRLSEKEQAIIA